MKTYYSTIQEAEKAINGRDYHKTTSNCDCGESLCYYIENTGEKLIICENCAEFYNR